LLLVSSTAHAAPLTALDCAAKAVTESPKVEEATTHVAELQARLARVESAYYPKLSGIAFVAPMFTVEGSALESDVERRWGPSDWGPYTRLEALLAQPLYTFGRAEAGAEAVEHRAAVERAQVLLVEASVALEVRRLYHLHLYARSMLPSLKQADELLAEALARGRELYSKGSGDVTQADLMKLEFGRAQVGRYLRTAETGATLSLAALKHTMGLPVIAPLELADRRLPSAPADPLDLEALLAHAAANRPEWKQIARGRKAAEALERSEARANLPVAFAAGMLEASWTPTRDDSANPYHNDPYNDVFGGVAVGLQFDIDPAQASARGDEARALQSRIEAKARLAKTGIPLQVHKAWLEVEQHRAQAELARQGVKAARKWMAFAGTAYATGTGDAKAVLEGVVAYLQAKRDRYESLRDFHTARAELDLAVGNRPWKD